jgi:cell division protein FtsB
VTRARWAAVVVLMAAAVFAWEGGTFSEPAYRALRRELAEKLKREGVLSHSLDSLVAFRDSLRTDPSVQERIARERFGMARPGETTFMIDVDSSADSVRAVAVKRP